MTQPTIMFSPRTSAISAQGGVLDVLVRVQAPDQPAHTKTTVTPKRLALVVDRSGSMDGQQAVARDITLLMPVSGSFVDAADAFAAIEVEVRVT